MSEITPRPIDDVSFSAEAVKPKPQSFAELMNKIDEKENQVKSSLENQKQQVQNETAENTQNQEKIKELKKDFEKAEVADYKNENVKQEAKVYAVPNFKAQKERSRIFPSNSDIDAESLTQIEAIKEYFGVSAGVAMHGLQTAMLYDEN